jgi:hypothetical protein
MSETPTDADRWPSPELEAEMLADAEIVEVHTGPGTYTADLCCHVRALLERVRALEAERDELQAFKDWVHAWLDGVGVPHDPDPEHTAEHGCRISGRMRYLLALNPEEKKEENR